MTVLKINKLPDTTPIKHTFSAAPELNEQLNDYARVYAQAYGEEAKVADLVPLMLESFMASDSNFKKARKALS